MVARLIRDLSADFISLKLGINIQGGASLGPRALLPAIIGFVQIVRDKHADTPITLISPIISPPREEVDNPVGLSLSKVRATVQCAFERLRDAGDKNLFYVNGLNVMGENETSHLPDDLHPDAEGYRVMARNFEREVFARMIG